MQFMLVASHTWCEFATWAQGWWSKRPKQVARQKFVQILKLEADAAASSDLAESDQGRFDSVHKISSRYGSFRSAFFSVKIALGGALDRCNRLDFEAT